MVQLSTRVMYDMLNRIALDSQLGLARAYEVDLAEVLVTSLLDEHDYPTTEFKSLYALRWGKETFYGMAVPLRPLGQRGDSLTQW